MLFPHGPRTKMMPGNIVIRQRNEQKPHFPLAANGNGEHGIGIYRILLSDAAVLETVAEHHLLFINLGGATPMSCRIGTASLDHVAAFGNITLCPAEIESVGRSAGPFDGLMLAIPDQPLAVLSAEQGRVGSRLMPKLAGTDAALASIGRELATEAADHAGGALYRSELCDELNEHLVSGYTAAPVDRSRGILSANVLRRINQYVRAHIGEPIPIDTIADVAGHGRSRFPRNFRRSVGMSPHQYVVRLRLKHALGHIRAGRMSLAQIAVDAGFTDQSHLTRWALRVYGASPGQLTTT